MAALAISFQMSDNAVNRLTTHVFVTGEGLARCEVLLGEAGTRLEDFEGGRLGGAIDS